MQWPELAEFAEFTATDSKRNSEKLETENRNRIGPETTTTTAADGDSGRNSGISDAFQPFDLVMDMRYRFLKKKLLQCENVKKKSTRLDLDWSILEDSWRIWGIISL